MLSQWNYFLKNLGTWEGSFTHLSAEGKAIKDTPTGEHPTFAISNNT